MLGEIPEAKSEPAPPVSHTFKGHRITQLACFAEVRRRLLVGDALSAIAQFIQEERHEYTDVSRSTLVHTLSRYRATLPPGEVLALASPKFLDKARKKLAKGVDELEELTALYQLQLERVTEERQREIQNGELSGGMLREVQEAKNILLSLARLKLDMGLTGQHAGTVELPKVTLGNPLVDKALSNPQSRQRLIGLVGQFVQLQKRTTIEAEGEEVNQEG